MLTEQHLVSQGVDLAQAKAVAALGSGMTWQQWLKLIQAILAALGGINFPGGTPTP